MNANLYDLISQGVTLALVIYFGLHLRAQLRTLKNTVDVQEKAMETLKKTIDSQSGLMQDSGRLNEIMKRVLETVSDPASLERERAYRARVERDITASFEQQIKALKEQQIKALTEQQIKALTDRGQKPKELTEQQIKKLTEQGQKAVEQVHKFYYPLTTAALILIARMLPYLSPEVRSRLTEDSDLDPHLKKHIQDLVRDTQGWSFLTGGWWPHAPSLEEVAKAYVREAGPTQKVQGNPP